MPGAQVVAVPARSGGSSHHGPSTTDGAGAFRIGGLPPAGYLLVARQGPLVGRARTRVALASAAAVDGVEIRVSAGAVLTGTVRSQRGTPVAGAEIQIWAPDPAVAWIAARRGQSDPRGQYRLEGLVPGIQQVRAGSDGYGTQEAELNVSGEATTFDFVLPEASVVSALVLEASGAPARGAEVQASTGGDQEQGLTGADGRFRFQRLEPGPLILVARRGDEIGRAGPEPLAPGATLPVTVRLERGARVSGNVRWEDGEPASGVEVEGSGQQPEGERHAREQTGADGAFSLGPFFAGPASVRARPPADVGVSHPDRPGEADLVLSAGEHRTGVQLTLARRSGSIHGRVSGPEGQPIAGVVVQAARERGGAPAPLFLREAGGRAVSGGDGGFALEGLTRGRFTVWTTHPEHPVVSRAGVVSGTRDLGLRLERGAALAGAVVDAGGAPVTAYSLLVAPHGPGGASVIPLILLSSPGFGEPVRIDDPRGAFRIDRLPAGSYDLDAHTPDGRSASLSEVPLAEGQSRQGLRLVLGARDGEGDGQAGGGARFRPERGRAGR